MVQCPDWTAGTKTTYTYDGLDRQRSSTISGSATTAANDATKSFYDGLSDTLIGQVDAQNGTHSDPNTYYQLDPSGAQIGFKQTSLTASWLDDDGQGSVTTQTTTAGGASCAVKYDPFGSPLSPATGANGVCSTGTQATTTANAVWYRGYTRDAAAGSYQLGTRTYQPGIAGFTTPDTHRVSTPSTDLSVGVDPLTANTYGYVNGDPVNAYDPSGHAGKRIGKGKKSGAGLQQAAADQAAVAQNPLSSVGSLLTTLATSTQAGTDLLIASLEQQKADAEKAADGKFDYKKAIIDLGLDFIGVTDAMNCVTKGDVMGCVSTLVGVGFAAIAKSKKIANGIADLFKAVDRFNDARRAAKSNVTSISDQLDDLNKLKTQRRTNADANPPPGSTATDSATPPRNDGAKPARGDTPNSGTTKSNTDATSAARQCSFTGETTVLMADGTRKPIQDVRVGDEVLATDPQTGERKSRRVEQVFVHQDTVIDLVVGGESIGTTEDHPFWSVTDQRFERADELSAGELVLDADGNTITVTGLDTTTARDATAYNLAINDIHTYHVGDTDILVHNTCDIGGGGDFADLSSASRRSHILDGEVRPNGTFGGGHRPGTGFPNKSEFPAGWSDDKIMDSISDVATDPKLDWRSGDGPSDYFVNGTRDGIDIEVLIRNNQIWTGYPTNVLRNAP